MHTNLDSFTSSIEYRTLLAKRRRLIWPLLILTLVSYFSFILAIAFAPAALGKPVGDGVISIGILLGLGLIVLNFVITLLYVRSANRTIEPLIARVHAVVGESK